jgi:hypothetical protein
MGVYCKIWVKENYFLHFFIWGAVNKYNNQHLSTARLQSFFVRRQQKKDFRLSSAARKHLFIGQQ